MISPYASVLDAMEQSVYAVSQFIHGPFGVSNGNAAGYLRDVNEIISQLDAPRAWSHERTEQLIGVISDEVSDIEYSINNWEMEVHDRQAVQALRDSLQCALSELNSYSQR